MTIPELDIYQRFGFSLLYWPRVGDDPKEWKGPHKKGWNDRDYDLQHYDPAIHNLGVFTGREITPGKHLTDVDFDKLNVAFAKAFFPDSHFVITRPGKLLSHTLYTTPTPLEGVQEYDALSDNKPYIELRGTKNQTMLPPSLHTPPDIRVSLVASSGIGHAELSTLQEATLNYAIASLVAEAFPGGVHHDLRMALAGYLLKRKLDDKRVAHLLQTICAYQVDRRVPDMSNYDIDDVRTIVRSTMDRLAKHERVIGSTFLKDVNADFVKRLQTWLPRAEGPVNLEDFYAYMPTHAYLFIPSREFWPASSVNSRIASIPNGTDDNGKEKTVPANIWLDSGPALSKTDDPGPRLTNAHT